MTWESKGRWCMTGDKSASTPATPPRPIQTMSLASVTHSGPHSPHHLLTTAIHTAVSPNQHTTATCNAPARFEILLQTMSSRHMLSRGLRGRGVMRGWEKSHLYARHLREACVCHPPYRGTSEGTDRCSMRLRLWGGGHGRLRGCKRL